MVSLITLHLHYAHFSLDLLASFLENFKDENTQVQLQLLTAVVKLFLKRPKDTQEMVQQVLNLATQESDNPDLRDRGFIYWRLLSTDPEAAKAVVLAEKPLITDTTSHLDDNLLNDLIPQISTLASVYHKPPESFVTKLKGLSKGRSLKVNEAEEEENEYDQEPEEGEGNCVNTFLNEANVVCSSYVTPTTSTPPRYWWCTKARCWWNKPSRPRPC